MPPSLRAYAALARRARVSYRVKLAAAAAVGAAAAPVAAAAYVAVAGAAGGAASAWGAVAAAALGAAGGALAAGWLVHALLAPVTLTAAAMRDYLTRYTKPALPVDLADADEAGALMADVQIAVERLDEIVVHVATYDRLTGLPNRALFRDQLRHAAAQARRDGRQVGVMVLNLEGFQQVHLSLGHAAGDVLLAAVAQRLGAVARDTDVLARLDGEEYAVLCHGGATVEGLDALARRMLEAVQRPFPVQGRELTVGASIGISLYPSDGASVDALMSNASAALYDVRQAGGGQHRFYSADLNAGLQRRVALEGDLRHALERGEFVLHYQPKVEVSTGRVRGFEALLRWQHPERGMVQPNDFIPAAESTGLIVGVGAWVLRAACQQIAAWRDAGLPPASVAVNLSARQFKHGDLVATVQDALAASGVDPSLLELEVTESLLMDDTRHTVAVLQALRAEGVTISLDDFGTGYSSLAYLKRFPLDCIKLDKSFVRDAVTDAQSSAITTAIVSLGRSLGLTVVAEGVETPEQLAYVAGRGCEVVQGFLFGRPMPADLAATLLAGEARAAAA